MAAAAQRIRIPVPTVQPYLQVIGDPQGDIRHWTLNFDAYLDCINRNQDPAHPLQDADKNALLISHLGQEGLRSFGGTPEYEQRHQLTYLQLKNHVIQHFRRAPSTFKARYDFFTRRQEPNETVKEFLLALRAVAVDCGFENITQANSVDEHIKTQLVCHTSDSKARVELFSRRDPMTLQDVTNFLTASEAAAMDTKGIGHQQTVQAVGKFAQKPAFNNSRPMNSDQRPGTRCGQCGGLQHRNPAVTCPAKGQKCMKCNHIGHFARVCRQAGTTTTTATTPQRGQFRNPRSDRGGRGSGQRSTKSRNRQVIPETSIPRPEQPRQQWGVDITGPFFNEGRYIVAAIDYTTRYPEILATKDISSQAIIKWLETLWDRYGTPTALVTDNGTQFTSREFQEYLRQKDIHQYTTPVYHPQQNGLVEVFNRTLKHGIQAFGKVSWEKGLRNLIRSYRLAPNDEGKSPFELMFGRKFRPDWVPNTTKPVRRLAQTKMDHANQESPGQEKMWTSWSLFHKGQLVYKKIPWVPKGTSPWKGPCSIVKVMGSYTFLLDDGQIWHSRNLKRAATSLPEPEQWVGVQIPPPQSPLRRSTRSTRGHPPKRLNM